MLTIALTGGIGSGKTTVSNVFHDLGAPILDADEIARDVVQPGEPALAEIAEHFGSDMLDKGGRLNRPLLRETIFQDESARMWLQNCLHPRIRERIENLRREYKIQGVSYVILSIPLYFESDYDYGVDRVCVVDVPEALQLTRACTRDGMTKEKARAMIATQVSRQVRLSRADDVIENQGSLDELQDKVERLHQYYLKLSSNSRS